MDLQWLLRDRRRGADDSRDLPLIGWLALGLLGCGAAPSPEPLPAVQPASVPAPVPAPSVDGRGEILFLSERDGSPRTWRIGAGTRGEVPVTGPPGSLYPAPSDPRGTHALMVSASDGPEGHAEQLWLVPLAGGQAHTLSPPSGKIRLPSWSPDGSWVVFESDAMSFRDLFRVDRDGSGMKRLTEAEHGSFEPEVSPDGSRIAFGTSRDGNAEVYTMAADGSDPRRITENPGDDVRPRWSPDGKSLAWIGTLGGRTQVWVKSGEDKPHPLRQTRLENVDLDHQWSPDGQHVAVTVQSDPRELDIEIVDAATGKRVAMLGSPGVDEQPAWSPDGAWIAWSSARSGEPAIFVARPDGTAVRQVSAGKTDWLPRWIASKQP